jgi:cbb3-type cytochrome oxidase subunit 3/RNA polymerase subunit RPABC4/transcription elongation factor Spt4
VASFTDQIGQGVAGFANLPAVHLALTAASMYLILVWLACTFWVFQDARRRQANVVAPYAAAAAIVLASPAVFPLALLVYRIVRPSRTLSEARRQDLEDRLTDLDQQSLEGCPECRTAVDADWLVCPECRTRLAHGCDACGRSMRLDWSVCAWCGADVAQPTLLDAPEAPPAVAEPAFQPRREAATA